MKTIAYIVSSLRQCGPTNQLSYIIHGLSRELYRPIVITLSKELKGDSLLHEFEDLNVDIHQVNLGRLKSIFYAKQKVMKIIDDESVDIVHTQGIRADLLSAIYFQNYYRVATLRNYPPDDYRMTYGILLGAVMSKIHLWGLKKLESPCVCSNAVALSLRNNKYLTFRAIENGVRIDRYISVNEKVKLELKHSIGVGSKKKVFVSVGLLTDRKDPLFLIEAFKALPHFQLFLVGGGDLLAACKKMAIGFDNIKIIGSVDDVKVFLQASDYYISSSKSEGLPNAVMEALACGLPSILSDITPHVDILKYDGNAGAVFKLGDFTDLCLSINRVLSLTYEDSSLSARNLIVNNLSSSSMSASYQDCYRLCDTSE